MTKGLVYYSDCRPDPFILDSVRKNILSLCNGYDLVSITLKPFDLGRNFVLPLERSRLTMFKQILRGLHESSGDIVFLVESDVLYHPSHFDFVPPKEDVFYYNQNTWKVDYKTGQALFYYCKQVSGLCAYKPLLIEHYTKRVERTEREGYDHKTGYEPGCHQFPRGIDNCFAEGWMSEHPNVDIRHNRNMTANRWSQDLFRDKSTCLGWTMADEVPGWGVTKGRFKEFLQEWT